MKTIVLILVLLITPAYAGVGVIPLTPKELLKQYDENQTEFMSRCFYLGGCADSEIHFYKKEHKKLADKLETMGVNIIEDKLWDLFK